jgi:hypothetical protein
MPPETRTWWEESRGRAKKYQKGDQKELTVFAHATARSDSTVVSRLRQVQGTGIENQRDRLTALETAEMS